MKQQTAAQLINVIETLVSHSQYCVPRVHALEKLVQYDPAFSEKYRMLLEGLQDDSASRESAKILAGLRKALVQDLD